MIYEAAPPQVKWTEHLVTHDRAYGAIGAGLGKSASTLDALNTLFDRCETIGALVVAPLRVASLTWPMEVSYWDQFKWMRVANLRTPLGRRAFLNGTAHLYLVNYESLHILKKLVEQRGTLPYDTIIFDEIDTARNPQSKRINMLRRGAVVRGKDAPVSMLPQRRWGMTGTPADRLIELFAQFRLLDDGQRLGKNYELFRRNFFKPIGYMGYQWEALPGAAKRIEDIVHDITLTMRTSDWLPELADIEVRDIDIDLTKEDMERYRTFEKDLLLELQRGTITAHSAGVLMTKLLQFTSGAIYDENRVVHPVHDLKIKALGKIVKEASGPVLVACQYQHEQDNLRKAYPQARFFQDAKTTHSQTEMLAAWNAKKIPILVAHPKSMSHGLNMQGGGEDIVWMTLPFGKRSFDQTNSRLARRGQKGIVKVHRLMCPGTADEAVAAVLQEKRDTEQRLLSALMLLESVRESPAAAKKIAGATEKQFAADEEL